MSMSDPLADMLTRIRNANMVRFESVEIPHSKMKVRLADVLKKEGFINDYHIIEDDKQGVLRVDLRYDKENRRVLTGLRRMSKPGCRVYVKSDKIPKVMSGLGIGILSTSKGVVSDREARALGLGGEYICEVW